MTREEQKSITGFIERAAKPHDGARSSAIDVEADAIIRALFVRNPEAAYRITLLAMAQADELARMRRELDEARQSFRANWLARILKKPNGLPRVRRDPRLSMFPQNIRSGSS